MQIFVEVGDGHLIDSNKSEIKHNILISVYLRSNMQFSGVVIAISAFIVVNDNRLLFAVLRRKYKVEINEGKSYKTHLKWTDILSDTIYY